MKTVFLSNRISRHQLPLCRALAARSDFLFVETLADNSDWHEGWKTDAVPDFVYPAAHTLADPAAVRHLVLEADTVLIGSAPDAFIIPRLRAGKLTFRYMERFYREGLNLRTYPRARIGAWLHHGRFRRYPLYMLCASAYTAADCARFGGYPGRCYRWGYFPETDFPADSPESRDASRIFWAGRMLPLKHPELAVEAAAILAAEGLHFTLEMAGDGEMREPVQALVREKGLQDRVCFPGMLPPDAVREKMAASGIFLMTSDFREGWGAVVNEAMACGCAVAAGHGAGSVPMLLEDGVNGRIFRSGSVRGLTDVLRTLLTDPAAQKTLGEAARRTVAELWNADTAAARWLALSQAILDGAESPELFPDGPCSRAELLANDWFRENP